MNRQKCFIIVILAIVCISWFSFFDEYSEEYTDKSLAHAAATYGIARGINAVVSVIQSTEVSIGVASISPGEFLDPLNDLIERFSWIIMMAMASIGLQKLLLTISSGIFFKVFITITGTLLIVSVVVKNIQYQNALMRLFIVALFLRFAVGGVVWANNLVEEVFLEEQRMQATESLNETKNSLTDLNEDIQKENELQSWWQGFKDTLSNLTSDHEARFKQYTESASSSIIDLIVVYLAQTILFPILFLWVFIKMMRWVWAYNWASFIKPELINVGGAETENK